MKKEERGMEEKVEYKKCRKIANLAFFSCIIILFTFISVPLLAILFHGYGFIFTVIPILVFTLPAISIILAVLSLILMKKRNIKGKTLSYISIILNIILILIIITPNLIAYYINPKNTDLDNCKSCIRNLGLATENYIEDHKGQYPPDLKTLVSEEYLGGTPTCPQTQTGKEYVYRIIKSSGTKHFEISCPNPEKHKYNPIRHCTEVKYVEGKGQITCDKHGKPIIYNE